MLLYKNTKEGEKKAFSDAKQNYEASVLNVVKSIRNKISKTNFKDCCSTQKKGTICADEQWAKSA